MGENRQYLTGLSVPATVFWLFATLLTAGVSFVHIFDPINIYSYGRDVWHHLATLNALMDSPFHPANPHVDSTEPSRSFSLWFLALALVGKAFHLDGQHLLGLSAFVTTALLSGGVYLFARTYYSHPWAPTVLLTVMLGAWGLNFNWAGLYNISTLLFSISFPFGIVLVLGFYAWWATLKILSGSRYSVPFLALIAGLSAFMFVTHQLQAGFALGGIGVFALFWGDEGTKRRAQIIAAAGIGVLASGLWPYFNPLSFILKASLEGWQTAQNWDNLWFFPFMTSISLLGAFGFFDFKQKKLRLELVVAALAIFLGLVIGNLTENPISHRFYPFLMIFFHLGLTWVLLSPPSLSDGSLSLAFRRTGYGMLWGLVGLSFAYNAFWGISNYRVYMAFGRGEIEIARRNHDPNILESARRIAALAGDQGIIIAYREAPYPAQAFRAKVVSIPRPFPLVHDMAERQAASHAFFQAKTSNQERCKIIWRFHVSHILFRTEEVDQTVQKTLAAFGKPQTINDATLISIKPALRPTAEIDQQEGCP